MPAALSTLQTAPRPLALNDLPLLVPQLFYAFLGVVERKLAECGLDAHLQPGMARVLLQLYEDDNCIIKDIGRNVRIAHGTLTGLLKRMERSGLLECRRCQADGRAVRVGLTPLGRSLESRVRKLHEETIALVQKGLSAGEVETAQNLIGRMLNSLRSAEELMRLKVRATPERPSSRRRLSRR